MIDNIKLSLEIDSFLRKLFPICRSLTGAGNRDTLQILSEIVPLQIKEYPSGANVYDWTIPDEWNIRDAWVKDGQGNKLINFHDTNLHVVGYSEPIHRSMPFSELREHIHFHEELPDAVPYRTTYYKRDWGFCMTQLQFETLSKAEGELEVYIDSEFDSEGSLTIGELLIPGESKQEILISTYYCHPSLANDNLSGIVMTAFLAREILKQESIRRSYRIIWVPETIGAIAYCAMNQEAMRKIQCGLVVTTVGGPGKYGYKQSFDSDHSVNLAIEEIFRQEGIDFITYPFDIHGSDERQFSSQGFRINTASLTKDKYYEYPYYHTSMDGLDFISSESIARSMGLYLKIVNKLDNERVYRNLYSKCEVMLSKHDLYPKVGGSLMPNSGKLNELDTILWLLWLSDGNTGMHEIANHLQVDESQLLPIADNLCDKGILESVV